MIAASKYRGRFAPSPTGPLHFGSLLAAMASYVDARAHGGEWLLRIEDIDPPREVAGAADAILRTLEQYGFEWDGEVVRQSARAGVYQSALRRLAEAGVLFACQCPRKQLLFSPLSPAGEHLYPGTCRHRRLPLEAKYAWRIQVPNAVVSFRDALQGEQAQNLMRDVGDFVVKRADGLVAYQLAVVVDDADQAISHVVRGSDLLESTARQIWLQRMLSFQTPNYLHIPIAIDVNREKLSKQTLAQRLPTRDPLKVILAAWRLLDQPAPPGDVHSARSFWTWAAQRWSRLLLPPVLMLPAPAVQANA